MVKLVPKVTVVVLTFVAAFLSYQIFERYYDYESPDAERAAAVEQKRETSTQAGLSSSEQRALDMPGPNATEEERAHHFALVQSIAKPADFLDISGCVANPAVLEVKHGLKFTVRNTDNADRKFVLNQSTFFIIPAESDIEITADFEQGPGVYGYGCDNGFSAIGVLFIVR